MESKFLNHNLTLNRNLTRNHTLKTEQKEEGKSKIKNESKIMSKRKYLHQTLTGVTGFFPFKTRITFLAASSAIALRLSFVALPM